MPVEKYHLSARRIKGSHHTSGVGVWRACEGGNMYLIKEYVSSKTRGMRGELRGAAGSDKAETSLTKSTLCIQVEECLSGVEVSSLCEGVR